MPTHNKVVTLGALFPPAYHRPHLRYLDGDQGGAPAGADNDGGTPPADPPFVPVKDRPVEEQLAYWRNESKKQQKEREKYAQYGTPDEIKTQLAELADLKRGPRTDDEKKAEQDREDAEKRGGR